MDLNLKAEHPSTHQKLAPDAAGIGAGLFSGLPSVLVGLMPRHHHCCSKTCVRLKPPSFHSFVKSDVRLISCLLLATDFNTLSTQTFRRTVSMTSDVKAALLSSVDVFSALMAQQGDDLAPRNVNQHHLLLRCINYTAGPPQESLIAQADTIEVTPLLLALDLEIIVS